MSLISEPMRHDEHMCKVEVNSQGSEMDGITNVKNEGPSIYIEEEGDVECHNPQVEYEMVITPAYQIRTHTGKRPFVCESCNTTVLPNDRPWNHMRVIGGGRPIVRHVYYMNFTRKNLTLFSDRKDKSKGRGGVRGKRHYTCVQCGRIFWHKSHFDDHLRMHAGEKPFSCTYCNKSFSQKSNLQSHIKRHIQPGKIKEEKNPRAIVNETVITSSADPMSSATHMTKSLDPMGNGLTSDIPIVYIKREDEFTEEVETSEVITEGESLPKIDSYKTLSSATVVRKSLPEENLLKRESPERFHVRGPIAGTSYESESQTNTDVANLTLLQKKSSEVDLS